ncbi:MULTISPECIES: DMT family transporter [unclassified Cellulophaga]|uniref:DMT family transporter n=1 Tax=unclassified Cellulophaga TaxID=2634405 RepID=UPI000C2BECAA|nr:MULTISPECIES: EamA family transporter [unclassified Cellulophaga]MDO6493021.1 EamA family transporter [Cellulophaga sp. 2_MG-2023]MDO6495997.1 EamA family transporter [Cellulophaga sp. 3_MG-2023]PKB43582.1 EamA domain-containing membrane protein RarD [Cellulophaga sp. RHA19]
MLSDKFKNYLHLHFIVFVWGFTAVLGKLITIDALPLVWYRMFFAAIFVLLFILVRKNRLKVSRKTLLLLLGTGVIIALHWVTFFSSIKVSNVSVTLATISSGAFFAAILEPIWYKRKVIWYEIVFGLVVIGGLGLIFNIDASYKEGIILALISAFLATVFSLMNGKLIKEHKPSIISFYELGAGVVFLSIYMLFQGNLEQVSFKLSTSDWIYILILASFCTAYAFIASVKIMKFLSPYTVMLTTNLEPVYGILLAFIIFGDSEKMDPMFYLGAFIILITVIANGILKNRTAKKNLKAANKQVVV